jgi:transcriptional regulator GlxA family with amidase domain
MQTQRADRHREIVAQFEEVARANLGKPVRLADLCRQLGVSPRALSRAFHAVGGTTPYRHVQSQRLNEARRALLSDTVEESITDIATRFGFRELGRFAVRYRETFGESPSETKRRARNSHRTP